MKYWKGYKYVVAEDFTVQTEIKGYDVKDKLTRLSPDGQLEISKGYPWDGNSGPCFDVKSSLEASCVHDILCDYVNLGWLPTSVQPMIDQEYYSTARRKGMWDWGARLRVVAVRWYMMGKGAKRFTRKIYEA